jgi:hypothetical protein
VPMRVFAHTRWGVFSFRSRHAPHRSDRRRGRLPAAGLRTSTPRLRRRGRRRTARPDAPRSAPVQCHAKQADDINSELLAAFLHTLRTDDLQAPRIWLRLCWAAWRAGLKARRNDDLLELLEPPYGVALVDHRRLVIAAGRALCEWQLHL